VICVLDTETTGLPNQPWARVVEVGAVVLDPHKDYDEVDAFVSLMYPGDGARNDHGLLDGYPRNASQRVPIEEIREAPWEVLVRPALYAFCERSRVTEVFSYNRVFDEVMLKRSGFVLPWTGCVMRMARAAMPPRPKDPSLADAAAHFGVVQAEAHRALPDARLAAQVFAAIRRKG
jgi:DNA polymerase III epsilon subunit-like protein